MTEFYNHPTDADISLLTKEYEYAVTIYRTFEDTLTADLKKAEMETIIRNALKQLTVSDTVKNNIFDEASSELKELKAHGDSFAVFISPMFIKIFNTPNRLNNEIKVGSRFNISNLLRAETFPQEGYVLIVNKDKWALYHGTKTEPASRVNIEQDATLTILTANNKQDGLKHVQQKSHKDIMKSMVPRYAQKLADTVKTILNETPTVVVADTILMGELRKHMPQETTIFIDTSMNPDSNTPTVEAILRSEIESFNQKIVDDFMDKAEKMESSDLIATDLADIMHAAVDGKIETLLIDRDWDEKAEYVDNQVSFKTEKSVVPFLISTVLQFGGGIKVTMSEEMAGRNFQGIMAVKRYN